MDSDRWRVVERLYHQALEQPEDGRGAFLKAACTGDESLRRDVESLLAVHLEGDAFLETPAVELAAHALTGMASASESWTDLRERLRTALADRYVIERELGRGGMATVYLAQDLKHGRPVALKVLHPELAATLGPARFEREIQLAARLQHPHILTVLDSGTAADQLWYAMQYVEGESLRDRLTREGQFPLEDALQITIEVADALGYAHGQGVVHRDVKPENILLSRGHALVVDFGVARALLTPGGQRLTEPGYAVGTPAYMSPEQAAAGREIDARTDIYSLACVLYEMLAGEPPYTGPSAQVVIAKRFSEPVPHVRSVREGVPEAVEHALGKALAKAPADRFSSAAKFAEALAHSPQVAVGRGLPKRSVFAVLVIGLLAGGALFAWRRMRNHAEGAGSTRLAVLPFENLGQPGDEYFADGVSDAIRGKLTALPGLAVIARTSSMQYRQTGKSLRDIGRELGVRYLLTGTVRWAKDPAGSTRVEVSPELIDVQPTGAPESRWQEPFDAAIRDVFQVQGDIASKVAQTLRVTLGGVEHHALAARPTDNLAAYDAYLQGEAASQAMNNLDLPSLDHAATLYARAVSLDSTFALAWTRLAQVRAYLYTSAKPTPAQADATRRALERAVTLAPGSPETQWAIGIYESDVHGDHAAALQAYETGLARAPSQSSLLTAAAREERELGRWDQALTRLERAQTLDPRSVSVTRGIGYLLLNLRRWRDARVAIERGLSVDPTTLDLIGDEIVSYLGEGNLASAKSVWRAAPPGVDQTALAVYLVSAWDLDWFLDDAQQRRLIALPASAFGDDRAQWNGTRAAAYWWRGDRARARVYADLARRAFEAQLAGTPSPAATYTIREAFLGLELALLGQRTAAIREGEAALARLPGARSVNRAYTQHTLARIYVLSGEPDKAIDLLEQLLRIPYYLSPAWLRIDPNFAPLRGNPRFERLLAQQ